MPTINTNMYVPPRPHSRSVLFNTVDNVNTAAPVPQTPGGSKAANTYLRDEVYYLNSNEDDMNGYLYIGQPYNIDRTAMYIYDDFSTSWQPFVAYTDCIEYISTITDSNQQVYYKYRYGLYDDDVHDWINTSRNLSFNLV